MVWLGRCVLVRTSTLTSARAFSHTSLNRAERARSTLSKIWVPTGGVSVTEGESGHGKLIRAGFLRQAHSGIFQLLPLGLRVQQKIEALLDKHMESIGASRLSLSTITSEDLWRKSGRLEQVSPELFRLTDRKDMPLMLSPTHEEEITTLVAGTLKSYKDLPLRLYQTTRKYRDEMRPRHGLLRSREFTMKDLYTFDTSMESAIETYREVSGAYRAFFADLKLPVLVAEASSGDMGGDQSHEYHLASAVGEDTVATCTSCGYTANDEVAMARPPPRDGQRARGNPTEADFHIWRGITEDRKTLVNAWYPRHSSALADADINVHAVKEAVTELDASINDPLRLLIDALGHEEGDPSAAIRLINVVDSRLASAFGELQGKLPVVPTELGNVSINQSTVTEASTGEALNLLRLADGDGCPRCETGSLEVHRALELGHTFYLGTRYSEPLELSVSLPNSSGGPVPIQMGCYGIGVSRIFGAVAEHKADQRGLSWPRAIAPFEVVIIPTSGVSPDTLGFYDMLASQGSLSPDFDVVLDDRRETFGWKMQDADMIGYPVTVVLGKSWRERGICEVQCRSLALKENVPVDDVPAYLRDLLARLAGVRGASPSTTLRPVANASRADITTMSGERETINLDTLEPQQLAQVKKQLDEELEHLTSSFAQLHGAQNKFKDCLRCVHSRSTASDAHSSVLVPLTNSLYVRGELTDSDSVLVDVGTGFLVEKKLKSAERFYEGKVSELSNNLKELEVIVQRKQANVRAVEEVLRLKLMAAQGSQA
ncbi:Uncharacterized protein TPAR_04430 [Tolypocladium paradoxum]|uniref:proline--tRNA ligase n=1 Tax=Tolypocladium paradoxum TaxID=94208 RepID=A0A2S4KYW3_9HYPO|nr:Uncharacterized protein TPAR_04430 [Tolypocladium paradoxum]